jgi:hypothetical protein
MFLVSDIQILLTIVPQEILPGWELRVNPEHAPAFGRKAKWLTVIC